MWETSSYYKRMQAKKLLCLFCSKKKNDYTNKECWKKIAQAQGSQNKYKKKNTCHIVRDIILTTWTSVGLKIMETQFESPDTSIQKQWQWRLVWVQETEEQWLSNPPEIVNTINDRERNIPYLDVSLNKSKVKAYIDIIATVSLIAESLVQE